MGLEAEVELVVGGDRFQVKALLETHEIIFRGGFKKKFAAASITKIAVDRGALRFHADGEDYVLELGSARAETWAKKLSTPAPSLASKLGVSSEAKVHVIGETHDAELDRAVQGLTSSAKDAALFLAVCRSLDELKFALHVLAKSKAPVWIANIKGAKSPFGENAIRAEMRALGFRDTKICAVSAVLSATRYNRST